MLKDTAYLDVATMAARLEIDGDYARAALLWKSAGNLAKSAINEVWCRNRAELCGRKGEGAIGPQ